MTREELEALFRSAFAMEQAAASARTQSIAKVREVISGIEISGDMDWFLDEAAAEQPYPYYVRPRPRTSAVEALRETHRQISDAANKGTLDLKRFRISMRAARIAVLNAEKGRCNAGCAPSEALIAWLGVHAHLAATAAVGYALWAGIPCTSRMALRQLSALSLLAAPGRRLASAAT